LQKLVESMGAPPAAGPGGPGGPEELGMGMPQAAMGNAPNPLLMAQGADVTGENQMGTPTVGAFGGPTEPGGV
jgi:hypothetical protein